MDVKCALYNDRGTYLEDITIKVSYLGAKKTWYMASTPTSPDILDHPEVPLRAWHQQKQNL